MGLGAMLWDGLPRLTCSWIGGGPQWYLLCVAESAIVVFRFAKERTFTERKATLGRLPGSLDRRGKLGKPFSPRSNLLFLLA